LRDINQINNKLGYNARQRNTAPARTFTRAQSTATC